MHRLLVKEIMQWPVVTIGPDQMAADAAQLMEEYGIRRLPVVDESEYLVGFVTDTDVLEAETAEDVLSTYEPSSDEDWLAVADIMTAEVITVEPETTVGELAQLFLQYKIGGVPVVLITDSGNQRVVGIVTELDVFRPIAEAWMREQDIGVSA